MRSAASAEISCKRSNSKRANQIVLNFGGYLGGGERMNPIDLGSGEGVCSHLVHHKCIPCTDFLVNALNSKINNWMALKFGRYLGGA